MTCASERAARLQARLTRKEAQLELAYDSYDELIADNTSRYRLDTTEGEQEAQNRSIAQAQKGIRILEAEIDSLHRRLCGQGLVAMKLRRKPS
jgi:hypothetical protein